MSRVYRCNRLQTSTHAESSVTVTSCLPRVWSVDPAGLGDGEVEVDFIGVAVVSVFLLLFLFFVVGIIDRIHHSHHHHLEFVLGIIFLESGEEDLVLDDKFYPCVYNSIDSHVSLDIMSDSNEVQLNPSSNVLTSLKRTKYLSKRFFRYLYPSATLEDLLNSMEWFRKLSPYDRKIYLNDEEIVLRKNMLVQDLTHHDKFLYSVVDVEPRTASFSLTVMMGTHVRLGKDSVISWVTEDFLRTVCVIVETKDKGWKSHDEI